MAADRSYKSTPRTRKGALTSFGSRTDIGCLRDHNEDSLVVTPPLFAVADGMGGHAAGEVASEIAVRVLSELAPEHPDGEALGRAIEEANRAVIQAAREGRGRQGMGTTMTAAMLEGERLVIAQVGDSRAYLLHQGKLQQLTRDHSLMADMIEAGQLTPEEARTHPQRSVITRALGSDAHLHPDIYEINVETGDRLLICSDGLSGMIFDDQIENTLRRVQDPQRCASQLVNEAIAAGGPGSVLGLSFSHLERTTDVTVADLQPGVANRLNEGIRVDDMEAADALVKEYEDEIAARSKNQAEGGNAESGRNADAKDASDAKNGGAA